MFIWDMGTELKCTPNVREKKKHGYHLKCAQCFGPYLSVPRDEVKEVIHYEDKYSREFEKPNKE
jgi:hypothetical protein